MSYPASTKAWDIYIYIERERETKGNHDLILLRSFHNNKFHLSLTEFKKLKLQMKLYIYNLYIIYIIIYIIYINLYIYIYINLEREKEREDGKCRHRHKVQSNDVLDLKLPPRRHFYG